jgi:hypothetical protein
MARLHQSNGLLLEKEKWIGAVNHEKAIDHQEKITQTAQVT